MSIACPGCFESAPGHLFDCPTRIKAIETENASIRQQVAEFQNQLSRHGECRELEARDKQRIEALESSNARMRDEFMAAMKWAGIQGLMRAKIMARLSRPPKEPENG